MAKDNYAKVKNIRNNNKCLCEGLIFECEKSKKHNTAENHLIPKGNYLSRISSNNQVLVFDFENRSYSKSGGKLEKRNIRNANKFRMFCQKHDNYLFDEIENGNKFDEKNKKQVFQFSFRAFVFSYSEHLLKDNPEFNEIVDDKLNIVAKGHLQISGKIFENYKKLIEEKNWSGVETEIIRLNRKCEFITCWSGNLGMGRNISMNIFPVNNETIILLSYLKGGFSFSSKRLCSRLKKLSKSNEKKFIAYIEKIAVAFDHNIAINPKYWSECDENSKKSFYEIAHIFPKVKTWKGGIRGFCKLKIKKLKLKLIH